MTLRVKKLTLFSHGMACVDNAATVSGNATLTLSLPPRHMNDVLKTLSVLDEDGVIESVTYDAPTTNREGMAMDEVLHAIIRESQGAEVTLDHERGFVKGRLMGLQTLLENGQTKHSERVILLEDDGSIVTRNLSQMTKLKFTDVLLQELWLKRMKQCALGAQARKNTVISIATRGEGERVVRATYAVESPVYKVTYRFLLREDSVFLQAWAIVDNPSEEDLEDVEVVIVSGLPISFRHDLYNARYIERPVQQVSTQAGYGAASIGGRGGRGGRVGAGFLLKKNSSKRQAYLAESEEADDSCDDGMQVMPLANQPVPPPPPSSITPEWTPAAEAAAAGSVREYRVRERVTIRARESALLPLIMSTCGGGPVDVYSYHIRPTNTLRAVKIRNNTPAPFEAGPVAVYDEERLVGEGMLKACRPGKEELVPYCVNLECSVERVVSRGSGNVVESVAISGYFVVKKMSEIVTSYNFHAQREKVDVILIHDLAGAGYNKPVAKQVIQHKDGQHLSAGSETTLEPISTEAGVARYRGCVPKGGALRLSVTESRLISNKYEIRNSCTTNMIATLQHGGMVGKTAAERMRKVMQAQTELDEVRREIVALEKTIENIENAQARYRENVVAVGGGQGRGKNAGPVSEFIRKIQESEKRIEQLREEIDEKRSLEKELAEKVLKMITEFEKESALN